MLLHVRHYVLKYVQLYAASRTTHASRAQVIPNFRIRTIPVLGTLPAIFGMAAASWVLCKLAGAPFLSDPIFVVYRPQYETLLEGLQADEERLVGHCDDIAVDLEEVRDL